MPFLHWLYVNCVGNLVASAIWGLPVGAGFVAHHLHVRRNLAHLHRKFDLLLGEEVADDATDAPTD